MHDNAIPNSVKKSTKLRMKVYRRKQNVLTYNLLTSFLPSQPFVILIAKLRRCLFPWTTVLPRLQFKVPSKSAQLLLSKRSPFKKIWMSLSLKTVVISNSNETSEVVLSISTSSKLQLRLRNYLKSLLTWTAILSGWELPIFFEIFKARFAEPRSLFKL